MRPFDLSSAAAGLRCPAVQAFVRTALATGGILLGYYLFPVDGSAPGYALCAQAAGLACLAALIGRQIRTIFRGTHLRVQALEAFTLAVPAFLILFAGVYFYLERHAAADFNVPLTRFDALYFTISVLSGVGFGDIVPRSELAREIVTLQMIGDLILLGVAARLVIDAMDSGIHGQQLTANQPQPPDDLGR